MFKRLSSNFTLSKSKSKGKRPESEPVELNAKFIVDGESGESTSIPPAPSQVTIAIIGAGSRGQVYANYAKHNPNMLKVVAVNDICDFKCEAIAKEHSIPPENVFIGDWTVMTKMPKLADAVAICTTDQNHVGPAEAFADLKYHILLEKPMSVNIEECVRIYEAVKRNGVLLAVGHILRYNMYGRCLKKIIDSGALGEIISIQHVEMILYWHFAHSYVRGNWHKESDSSFSLLTKCCHDIDLLAYLMNQKCKTISSFGNLSHFKKDKKPKDAGTAGRCLECPLQDSCPYSAKSIYIGGLKNGMTGWPNNVVQPNGPVDIENLTEALNTSDYGRCVYDMDNDVCDHQVVNMEFENGGTASFSMVAFTSNMIRKTRIFGTMGDLEGDGNMSIKVTDFRTKQTTNHNPVLEMTEPGPLQWSGHGGGDFAFINAFVLACATGDPKYILSGPLETLESHMYVFAAEESRRTGRTVDIKEFKKKYIYSESE